MNIYLYLYGDNNVCLSHRVIRSTIEENTCNYLWQYMGFPGGSDSKESACNEGDPDSTPGSGKSPEEGNGNPL